MILQRWCVNMTNIEAATWLTKLYASYVSERGHWNEAAEAVAMACMALKEKEKIVRSAPTCSVAVGKAETDVSELFRPPHISK